MTVVEVDRVVIRFVGDSGDGMQLIGGRFTQETASFGNDLATLPNFPAEIRAPQGTLPGVSSFQVHAVDMTGITVESVKEFGLSRKDAARAKNMFALGLLSWLYGRPVETTVAFIEQRFAKAPQLRDANLGAFRAGWNYGETTEVFAVSYLVKPVQAATYDDQAREQVRVARQGTMDRTAALAELLAGGDTWMVV